MVKRLLDCTGSDFEKMNTCELKYSVLASEGRTVLAQTAANCHSHLNGVTNIELEAGFGADLIMVNNYNFKDMSQNIGFDGMTLKEIKALIKRPIGVYFECMGDGTPAYDRPDAYKDTSHRVATKENLENARRDGADFIVLGGNPGRGTTLKTVIENTRLAKEVLGDSVMIFSGKWEDGVVEKVLGDPTANYDAKEVIKELIDAGADVINLPAPGSRHGITVEDIRDLVTFVHMYKPGTLVMTFLDSSVEGADEETIRLISLKMKETGADIHAIGDAGYSGLALPENIYQMSITIRGRRFTFKRICSNNR